MNQYEFEENILKNHIYYVSSLVIDVLSAEVNLELVAEPETNEVVLAIKFFSCKSLTCNYHDEIVENYLHSLLGIQNSSDESGTRYIITTDVVELEFNSLVEPKVSRRDMSSFT